MKLLITRSVCLFAILSVTTGCSTLGAGVATIPKKPFSDSAIELIANKYLIAVDQSGTNMPTAKPGTWLDFNEKCLVHVTTGNAAELTKCRNYRDIVITDMTFIINHNYNSYEGNLLASKAKSDFYTGTARSAFETGATLIDATGVKTVLSALATFTGGTQTLAQEAFYYEQTGPALINAMRADRKNAYVPLLAGKQSDYKDYPLTAAMGDLDSYFRAGTMASAVIGLSKSTAQSDAAATTRLQCANAAVGAVAARQC
jgi:hypothetical protein